MIQERRTASFVQWTSLSVLLLQLLLFAAAWGRLQQRVDDLIWRVTRVESIIDKLIPGH